MGFNTASVWLKIALVCLALGTLLFVIGFATNAWVKPNSVYESRYGLWTRYGCWKTTAYYRHVGCGTADITSYFLESMERYGDDWVAFYRATQVFECLGLICAALALIVILIFVFLDRMRKRNVLIAIIVLSFIAVVCMAIGYTVFATQFPGHVRIGWSMGIAIAGTILIFIAAVMSIIDLKK